MPNDKSGLSTLEAVVAVAVLSLALIPLLEIQSLITRTHGRYERLYEQTTMQRNALVILRDLNPMLSPEGTIQLDAGVTMTWSSRRLTETVQGTGYPTGDGPFEVALYNVAVEVEGEDAGSGFDMTIERLGWRRTVEMPDSEFVPGDRTAPAIP